MTSVYEVNTKHTKEVLKAFIKFSYQVNHPKATFRLSVFGSMFLLLAYGFRGTSSMYILAAVGLLIILFTFTRQKIAFLKLSNNDPVYQKQTEVHFIFENQGWSVENELEDQSQKISYGEITNLYKDHRNYYVGVKNETLHIIPKGDFVKGSPEEFELFIKEKTKKEIVPPKMPIKVKWAQFKEKFAVAWANRGQETKKQDKRNEKNRGE